MAWMDYNFRGKRPLISSRWLIFLFTFNLNETVSHIFSASAFILPHQSTHSSLNLRVRNKRKSEAHHFTRTSSSSFLDASRFDYDTDFSDPLEKFADAASNWYVEFIQPKMEKKNDNKVLYPNEAAAEIKTLIRVGIPSIALAILAGIIYTPLCLFIANDIVQNDQGVFTVVSQDSSQYIQNILTTSGLMFSILTGYTYYFMYQQQEQLFVALFQEVSEAKSLLEQVSLICAGRQMYPQILQCIQTYVEQDLKFSAKIDPADLISTRAFATSKSNIDQQQEDPLEAIMYMTSVGTPGQIYDTVLSLRRARANRLGALQQKLPDLHMILLKALAVAVLVTFPVCGSGSQVLGGVGILHVQAIYFGILVFGIAMVLNVISELFKPRGGAYNIDGVLSVMVSGLDEELRDRLAGVLESHNLCFVEE